MKRADRQGRRWGDGGMWGIEGVRGKGGRDGGREEGRKVEKGDQRREQREIQGG